MSGKSIPKHIPMDAAPNARTYRAAVANGIPTAVNNGSRKLNAKPAPRRPVKIPE